MVMDSDLIVQTGDGCLQIGTVQLAGRKAMPATAFLRGAGRDLVDAVLTSTP